MELDINTLSGSDIQTQTEGNMEKPKPANNQQGNKRAPLPNYWIDANIEPLKITDLALKHGTKTFTVGYNGRADNIPADKIEALKTCVSALLNNGYTFRAWMEDNQYSKTILSGVKEEQKKNVEWYLPTRTFNPVAATFGTIVSSGNNKNAFRLAKSLHSAYVKIPSFVRALCARDAEVCLGKDLTSPLACIIIYTPCGSESITKGFDFVVNGQVTFLLKVANAANIPVFNINNATFKDRFVNFIKGNGYKSANAVEIEKGKNDYNMPDTIQGTPDTTSTIPEIDVGEANQVDVNPQPAEEKKFDIDQIDV